MRFLTNRVTLLVVVGIALGVVAGLASHLIPWLPESASPESNRTDDVTWAINYVSFAIFFMVMTVMAYALWRFRAAGDDDLRDGAPVHGHTGLELFWTAIPVAIVTVFGVWAGIILADNEAHAKGTRLVIATGFRYGWSYTYKTDGGFDSTQMVVPVDVRLEVQTDSRDVLHDFYVPEWRLKVDAIPGGQGASNRFWVTPDKTGQFQPLCAELCGPGHAQMGLTAPPVRVVSQAEFDKWLADQKKQSQQASPGQKDFIAIGCGGCHTLAKAGTTGTVGPALDIDQLKSEAAATGQDVQAFVHDSIVTPNAHIAKGFPANTMPGNYGDSLTEKQLNDLVNYLSEGAP